MPDYLTMRIETAIAAEVRVRTSASPAPEAGRRDLPERRRAPSGQHGWRLPGLSVPATRALAGAAAAAVVAVGGYGAAAGLGGGSTAATTSSSGGAGALMPTEQLTYGPSIGYGHGHQIRMVSTQTDFVPARLATEVRAAVANARQGGVAAGGNQAATRVESSPNALGAANAPSNLSALRGTTSGRLGGCVGKLAVAARVLLVELAKFDGRPAAVIVVTAVQRDAANVWIVGLTCSATSTHVLDHQVVTHI
jgi:hypothetical protein